MMTKTAEVLERIELQQKVIWWDVIMYFGILSGVLGLILCLLIGLIQFSIYMIMGMVLVIIATQLAESIEKKEIRKLWKRNLNTIKKKSVRYVTKRLI